MKQPADGAPGPLDEQPADRRAVWAARERARAAEQTHDAQATKGGKKGKGTSKSAKMGKGGARGKGSKGSGRGKSGKRWWRRRGSGPEQ